MRLAFDVCLKSIMAASEASIFSEELSVEICNSVVESLQGSDFISWGFLLGRISCSRAYVISIYDVSHIEICDGLVSRRPSKIDTLLKEILTRIPNGINIIGIYYNASLEKDRVAEFASNELVPRLEGELSEFSVFGDRFFMCEVKRGSRHVEIEFLEAVTTGDASQLPRICINYSAVFENDFFSSMYCIRAQCTVQCQLSTLDICNSIWQESNRISSKLKESQLALILKSSDALLILEDLGQMPVGEFLGPGLISDGSYVIDTEILISMSSDRSKGHEVYSPFLICNTTEDEILKFTLRLDAILYVEKSSMASSFLQSIRDALCIQAKGILSSMAEIQKEFGICKQEVFHFKPLNMEHLISVIYPVTRLDGSKISDTNLISMRKHMHNAFMLPADKPTFKILQSYFYKLSSSHLINPHIGLKPVADGGACVTVYGKYAYHHYMQDRFDDNGWGCAYRSLQTICSWFKLQGYVTTDVPDHKQIQETLVKAGDKPKNFIGSKQWIGSFEVSICLKEITQIESKILHVSSGAEMAFKGRELIEHFRTQGTPIMIGGGVLAHTILGIQFNESTGNIGFLILDPHYTGGEDLKTVQGKGWCGWKGPQFWDQTAHYNMCLPQRPIIF